MIETGTLGTVYFQWYEWVLIPALIVVIYFFSVRLKIKKINSNSAYKYLIPAISFKVFGGLFFGLIYIFYYGGADTASYYSNTLPLVNLFFKDPITYLEVLFRSSEIAALFTDNDWHYYAFNTFDHTTGIPFSHIAKDPKTFLVCKLTSPLLILTYKSYFGCTVLLSAMSFIPIWRLYITFVKKFPVLKKELAIALLFMPSVVFWGSGILKDTYTFAAVCLAVSAVNYIIQKKDVIWNLFILVLSLYSILSIKPYILHVLIPSIGLWVFALTIKKVQNVIFRFVVFPIAFVAILGGSFFVLKSLGGSMDKFALENALHTVEVNNIDLRRSQFYGSNYHDIGEIDGTIMGLISKFPKATFAGLFKPMIFEARNPVMVFSGLENLFLIVLLVLVFWRLKIKTSIQFVLANPILLFCFSFVILYGFLIGVTTPNYGALVRFKIPLIPFFVGGLLLLYNEKKVWNSSGNL